jgi:hypothetical protein
VFGKLGCILCNLALHSAINPTQVEPQDSLTGRNQAAAAAAAAGAPHMVSLDLNIPSEKPVVIALTGWGASGTVNP